MKNNNKISDETLFSKIKQGNILAFDTLFTRYYKNLSFYSNKIIRNGEIAEDIVQELFIKIWENRETIHIEKNVKSYLYRSVYNKSVNYLRDNKSLKSNDNLDLNAANHQSYFNADNDILYFELESKLFEIIDSLPEKQKKVFLLKRLDNYSYKEIALELGISEKMVGKYLSKAAIKLRTAISEYNSSLSINLLFFLI